MTPRKLLLLLIAAIAALAALPATASAWAPADTAPIHPGVQTQHRGLGPVHVQLRLHPGRRHLHRAGRALLRHRRGDRDRRLPRRVAAARARRSTSTAPACAGRWSTTPGSPCRQAGETDEETCAYNDFALVKLDPADVGKVNPSIPVFGGPEGIGTAAAGEQVYTYGNSSLRGGITQLSPKSGAVVERTAGGWSYSLYTVTPGHPRRLRLGVPERDRSGARHAEHRRDRAAARQQRRRRHRQRAGLRALTRIPEPAARERHRAVPPKLGGVLPAG